MKESDQIRRPRRRTPHAAPTLLTLVLLVFVTGGANCGQWVRGYTQPRMLPETATLDQIVTLVNDNANRVQSLQATQATLSVPGAPSFAPPLLLRRRAAYGYGPMVRSLARNWIWAATTICSGSGYVGISPQQPLFVDTTNFPCPMRGKFCPCLPIGCSMPSVWRGSIRRNLWKGRFRSTATVLKSAAANRRPPAKSPKSLWSINGKAPWSNKMYTVRKVNCSPSLVPAVSCAIQLPAHASAVDRCPMADRANVLSLRRHKLAHQHNSPR